MLHYTVAPLQQKADIGQGHPHETKNFTLCQMSDNYCTFEYYTASHSPLKAYIELFFSCIKESKGLPLQTSASGSGASVVAVVTETVVVSTVALVPWGSVVMGSLCVGRTVSEMCVICLNGLVISSVVSGWCCGL